HGRRTRRRASALSSAATRAMQCLRAMWRVPRVAWPRTVLPRRRAGTLGEPGIGRTRRPPSDPPATCGRPPAVGALLQAGARRPPGGRPFMITFTNVVEIDRPVGDV